MIFRVFAAALAAGVLAAVLLTGMQSLITTPMILEAETYEVAGAGHEHAEHSHDKADEAAADDDEEWAPQEGMERLLYTLLANAGAGVGFALMLVVCLTFEPSSAGAGRGVMFGMAGFAVFTLAPGLGLAPELPGMAAADLEQRQVWWFATMLCTASGLALLTFKKSVVIKIIGVILLAAPHIWGAPHVSGTFQVPAELAAQFSASTIALNGVFWLLIGSLSGLIFAKLGDKTEDA